jgi:hypothetical protein
VSINIEDQSAIINLIVWSDSGSKAIDGDAAPSVSASIADAIIRFIFVPSAFLVLQF